MKGFRRRYKCPDCGKLLKKMSKGGRLRCDNPVCTVIHVILSRGKPHDKIIRVMRAAVPVF